VVGLVTLTAKAGTVTKTATINLSAAGTTNAVALTWVAPTTSPDPVSGYNIYRAPSGSTSYQQINTATITGLAYTDSAVVSGITYDYIAKSVDATGNLSVASNTAIVSIP